jgi:hypothetical protein
MASTTITVLTNAITGAVITAKTAVASSQTATVTPTTAQSSLDFKSLVVRVENTSTTAGVTLSLGAGTEFSDLGIGAKSISIATATTVVIGGQTFEGSRFLTSGGTVIFTQAGTGPTSWEAYQKARVTE